MSALWKAPLATSATLLLLWGLLFGLGDRQVFTSPPEAVAEQFMRKLATGRYEVAMDQLSGELRRKVRPDDLKAAAQRLKERVGQIQDVRGEPGLMRGDEAEAAAVLTLQQGKETPLRFRLTRSQGAWAIDDLGDLAPPGEASAGG